jgi:hypothetical protein
MGAEYFENTGRGFDVEKVFGELVESAAYDYGHAGYTGTIVEKGSFEIRKISAADLKKHIEQVRKRIADMNANPNAKPLTEEQIRYYAFSDWAREDGKDSDKWGPAYCVEICPPDRARSLSKAAAEKLAQQQYGNIEGLIKLEIMTGRAKEGRPASAMISVTKRGNSPGPGFYGGFTTSGYGNMKECTYIAKSATGKDVDEARGNLFRRQGEWLFYGWASS